MSQQPRQPLAGKPPASVPDASSSPHFICGSPLKRGILYSTSDDGTKLIARATATEPGTLVKPQISPEQITPLPADAPPDARLLENLPDGLVIAIPEPLMQLTINSFGEERLGDEAIREARRLNKLADILGVCGFWNQRGIEFRFLLPQSGRLSALMGRLTNRSEMEQLPIARALEERLSRIDDHIRAYVGWLVTNLNFKTEHEQLCEEFREELAMQGFPTRRQITSVCESKRSLFHQRCWDHYEHWILDGVAAPGMPIPVSPHFPNLLQADSETGVLNHTIPDYFPISGNSWFLDMLDETRLTSQRMPQLAGWLDIIRKEDAQANKLAGYRRRLLLVIYWRGLMSAFPECFVRSKKKLSAVFAEFLKVSEDTIKNDLKQLQGVLDWP
ncbi:MAG: hypothetical protein KDA90_21930 [Planctomycetaceae bacterium]|nr:hypothetical protein [Planctomycetaceae bacterium]